MRAASELGGDFTLCDLQDCTVRLLGTMCALRMRSLRRCRVACGPVTGAIFVDGARIVCRSEQFTGVSKA